MVNESFEVAQAMQASSNILNSSSDASERHTLHVSPGDKGIAYKAASRGSAISH